MPEQTCSRTSERTHERKSEFVSLAHTRLGTSGDPGSGKRCSQKALSLSYVEMDLTGQTYPMMRSPRNYILKRRSSKVGNNADPRIWDNPAKNCFVALCELAERATSRSERRMNSSATFVRRTNLRKVICLRSWQTHTPNSIKVSE